MDVDKAFDSMNSLHDAFAGGQLSFNEADTRVKIIDRLVKECLGWPEDAITREDRVESGYLDYALCDLKTPLLVIEAKRVGVDFEIPISFASRTYKISGSISTCRDLREAMDQARRYSNDIGCRYAAVFNGRQVAVFPAITPGKPWTEGYCIIFRSLDDMVTNFAVLWNLLSYEAVRHGSLVEKVEVGRSSRAFYKPLTYIHNAEQSWARNDLYTYLQPIANFVFSELLDEARAEVLKECYIFERSNRDLSQNIEGFFKDRLPHFAARYRIKDIFERKQRAKVFEVAFRKMADRKAGLLLLMGGVGSGKSTFLHRFFRIVLASHENLLWFYIDYREASDDQNHMEAFTFERILSQWQQKYRQNLGTDLKDLGFGATEAPTREFFSILFNLLGRIGFSIVVIIDNVDQHDRVFQERLFVFSNHLSNQLSVLTIVAVREETFYLSMRTGVFDAFSVPKFHIAAPNFLEMIRKRITYTEWLLSNAKLRETLGITDEKVASDIVRYLGIILRSLAMDNDQSRSIIRFFDSTSVENMRHALEMFNDFLVSGNTNVRELFGVTGTGYQIALHQFLKSIILGEHRYYRAERSHVMNLYDFDPAIGGSHFHALRLLVFLASRKDASSPIGKGYVDLNRLLLAAEEVAIRRSVVKDTLLRLSEFRLVEYDNYSRTDIENAAYVSITPAGLYYVTELFDDFVYLDTVLIDTPISDESLMGYVRTTIGRFDLLTRLERTGRFIEYLRSAETTEHLENPQFAGTDFANQRFGDQLAVNHHTIAGRVESGAIRFPDTSGAC